MTRRENESNSRLPESSFSELIADGPCTDCLPRLLVQPLVRSSRLQSTQLRHQPVVHDKQAQMLVDAVVAGREAAHGGVLALFSNFKMLGVV